MNTAGYRILNLSSFLFDSINNIAEQDKKESIFNAYKNNNIYPPLIYNNNDKSQDFGQGIMPPYVYKTKSLFNNPQPVIQTEWDENGFNSAFFNNYYDYKDYGYFKYQNQNLPEYLKHKKSNDLFDLLY